MKKTYRVTEAVFRPSTVAVCYCHNADKMTFLFRSSLLRLFPLTTLSVTHPELFFRSSLGCSLEVMVLWDMIKEEGENRNHLLLSVRSRRHAADSLTRFCKTASVSVLGPILKLCYIARHWLCCFLLSSQDFADCCKKKEIILTPGFYITQKVKEELKPWRFSQMLSMKWFFFFYCENKYELQIFHNTNTEIWLH